MAARVRSTGRSLQLSLVLYGVIVALFAALLAWWVAFLSRQGERLAAAVDASGEALSPSQYTALLEATDGSARMFFFEGLFLGALILGSAFLVLRAVRREIVLARQQHDFLSAVTHELRSPLASAKLYIESIRLGRAGPEKTGRYLEHAQQDLQRLETTVDDLLAARRMTTEKPDLLLETLDLAALVRRAIERFEVLHADAGATIALSAAEPVVLRGDRGALEKIFDNLLSNAVKYGGEPPRIDVAVTAREGRAVLVVRDHGPGLQGADPKRLVQPFVRGRDEAVRTRPGVGLGLYLVDELVRAHRGRLALEDGLEDGGTRVTVELPVAPGLPAHAEPTHTWGLPDAGRREVPQREVPHREAGR